MTAEDDLSNRDMREVGQILSQAQIHCQQTDPRLQQHPPIVFQCGFGYRRENTRSVLVSADLLSETPHGVFDRLPDELVMQSDLYGDRWLVEEGVIFIDGRGVKNQGDLRKEGRFHIHFSPLNGMRGLEEGEVFRQVSSSRTDWMRDIVLGFPEVDQRDKIGCLALHWAACYGWMPLVSYLIERGEQIDGRSLEEATPLMEAVDAHHPDVIRLLLRSGAQVDALNKNGGTALVTAVYRNSVEAALVLLEFGADPNRRGRGTKETLLLRAVKHRLDGYRWGTVEYRGYTEPSPWLTAIEIVKGLLEHGAKRDAKDEKGKTALKLAQQAGDEELITLLKRA